MNRLRGLFLFAGLVAATVAWPEAPPAYNEVFFPDGTVRPQYEDIWKHYSSLNSKERIDFLKITRNDFKGDNALDPLPRVLTESEYNTLKRGVDQRGEALRRFLSDYANGNSRNYQAVISESTVQKIAERNNDLRFRDTLKKQKIAFPYGPDIIRDPSGGWRVLEDNTGYIGGPGDLLQARESLLRRMPEYKDIPVKDDPQTYFSQLSERYRKNAVPPDGKIVVLQRPPYPDFEDARLKEIYSKLGFDVVSPRSQKKLIPYKNGLYLEEKNAAGNLVRKRVGFVVLNGEPWDLDPGKGRGFPGLMETLNQAKVPSNYSAGVDFIGDKEFNLYVEDLVRHYMKEEPILKNVPTQKLSMKDGSVNQSALVEVKKNPKQWVLKAVDGRGGDAVWVGAKIKATEFETALKNATQDPERYVLQQYTPLSVLDDRIVDLRMISAVDEHGVLVSPTPWGRAIPASGNGKVNLSQATDDLLKTGRESPVLVVPDPKVKTKISVKPCIKESLTKLLDSNP